MKSALINRYFDLRAASDWVRISTVDGYLDLITKMMRIDAILFERYGYDVSLTGKN